jgi:hypothetical protein
MSSLRTALATIALLFLAGRAAEAAGELAQEMVGDWAGPVMSGSIAGASPGSELTLSIALESRGLAVALDSEGDALFEARVPESARPGVYATSQTKSMLGLFRRRDTSNPLEGEPLQWARSDSEMLVAYNFFLWEGAYRLDRLELAPVGEALELRLSRHGHGMEPLTVVGRLTRQDG